MKSGLFILTAKSSPTLDGVVSKSVSCPIRMCPFSRRRSLRASSPCGRDLDIRPHGLDALKLLRLEKGHILIGQDTDFDTTPSKVGLDFAVKMNKPDFIGRTALQRIASLPRERSLLA